jgi:class 3 adenylate cyclase/predicted ATPase
MTMEQIADWLEKRGMSEYAQRFIENRIDLSVLPDLTDQDLEKLGILLGDRRKILRWIADLKSLEKVTPLGIPTAPPPADSAERRQVTVLFADLVGSTALSERMDPEDLREIVLAYQNVVAETVHRFDGFVAEYHGDGVMVYFGYPHAHEDDPERSVQAGLELIAALKAIEATVPLEARIGIATGLVVVGDLIGTGDTKERSIVGETPNLAARLQAIAEPNAIVIAHTTRKLLGDLFELHDLGSRDLKGISTPVRPWVVLRPSRVESRFDALRPTRLTTLVGREEEFELLLRRWGRARGGEGQVVLVSGEPGIGKSRLTATLLDRLAAEPHTRLRCFCSPQHTEHALYPLTTQLQRAAGLAHGDTQQAKLDKLQAFLTQTSTSSQDAALFAELLSLPNDGRLPALDLAPQERRQKTLQALMAQVSRLAGQQPLLIVFEDVHWIDPTSLEFVGRTVDLIKTLPALLVVTFRSEFNAPWIGQAHVTSLALNRLAQRDVGAMIAELARERDMPSDVVAEIVDRTDGIPLFVEEMTKAVLETESKGAAQRIVASVLSGDSTVPASLHASLLARLDRLGPAKKVAQIGAAIGRMFPYDLLALVVGQSETELRAALHRLIQAGLLFTQGLSPHASYLFKHSLVQDAAYGMLLRESRRALHARIAETIECQFAEIVESEPELVAHHYTAAGLIAKAAGFWGKAGQRSLARSALVEGAAQLTRALEQMATLPGSAALRRQQIELQLSLAHALIHTKGHAAPETRSAYQRARVYLDEAIAAGEPPEDPLILFSVLFGFWVANLVAFDGDLARKHAAEFMERAQQQHVTAPIMIGNTVMGISLLYTGHIAEGRDHLDKAMALYNPVEHRSLAMRFGQAGAVSRLCFRALALWLLGYPDAACLDLEHALSEAREIGQAAALMFGLRHAIPLQILMGNYETANAQIEELGALAHATNASVWKGTAMFERAWLSALAGEVSGTVDKMTSALKALQSTGTTLWMPRSKILLAFAHVHAGEIENAWRCIDDALTAVETTKERWFEAEVYRMAGEITLLGPEPDAAKVEAHFERALRIAREQQAKAWELRAAISMARLWRDQGKRRHAHDLLAAVYGWFSEGFDTLDLRQARILLEELA